MSNKPEKGAIPLTDCLFCKIVRGEIPSQIVFENDQMIVFKDIQPVAPFHLLAIPKRHIDNIADPNLVDGELLTGLLQGIQQVATEMGLKENGFRVVANYGRDAGEAVHHLHFHMIAGRSLAWPPG
jgi:histidine triad (HIT) family protein